MPLVAHSGLPAFARLEAEGFDVLSAERAARQDIRELHIGLLNMMPDAALEATERQFLRLVGGCNRIAQIYVHPFGVRSQERGPRARAHMAAHYREFESLEEEGLDALIITGANPADPDLTRESFWPGMLEVMEWGRTKVCSMVCSCLATHAALKIYHGIERIALPAKRWGVYSHRLIERSHPLLAHIDTRFDAPHSHVYEVTGDQVRESGGHVLVESAEAGVHLAVSEDGFRFVYFQGHPEYDFNSLLKEHKREVTRFALGEREDFPPLPEHYYGEEARACIESLRRAGARRPGRGGRGAGAARGASDSPGRQHLGRHRKGAVQQLAGPGVPAHPRGSAQALHGRRGSGRSPGLAPALARCIAGTQLSSTYQSPLRLGTGGMRSRRRVGVWPRRCS